LEPVLVLIVVMSLGAGVYFSRRARSPARTKGGDAVTPRTLDNLEPGDALSFWDGRSSLVDTVLDCFEEVGARATRWQWVILDDGRLLEIAPGGNSTYGTPETLRQGSLAFEQLTGDHGMLKAFEQRVRDGVSGSQPVHFQHGEANYQARSTGTFSGSVRGKPLTGEVWRDISPKASDNVYFEMESSSGQVILGVWTAHVAWYVGQPLREADIVGIYPGGKEVGKQ